MKSIFITGAASGIGLETARLFAARGWFVGIGDTNAEALQKLTVELGQDRCCAMVFDVADAAGYRQAIDAFAARTGGRMTVLFNNAGILRMGLNENIPLDQLHLTIDINTKGVVNGVACALPLLKQTPGAHIISMCSGSAMYGIPELAVYSATKHFVRGYTEALNIELEADGIVVSDLIAPYINTPMVNAAAHQAYSVKKLGVNLKPAQIAAVVWRAAHGNRVHWRIHRSTSQMSFIFWLLPFFKRTLIKASCLTPRRRAS